MIITTRRCLLGGQTSFRTANGPATRRRLNRRKRSSRPAPRRVNGDSGVSAGLARRRSFLGFAPSLREALVHLARGFVQAMARLIRPFDGGAASW